MDLDYQSGSQHEPSNSPSNSPSRRRIEVIIPAHNEEAHLPAALWSLLCQTVPPDRITVVSDRSTDCTVTVAQSWGGIVQVIETHGNRHRKAGALNQALARLPMAPDTMVLQMDADTQLAPEWIETALIALADETIGAVGGVFFGDGATEGLLSTLQDLEYHRYAREIARDRATARVLTGTATMLRRSTLDEVAAARARGSLPGSGWYHSQALTEDFEMTLAIKHLGYRCVSPKQCRVLTELMPTLPMLWRQRTRWQRGAYQALRMYGTNRVTLPYIGKQAEMGAGLVALAGLWFITIWSIMDGSFSMQPVWLLIGCVFLLERIVTSWRAGWKGRLTATAFVPDMAFDAIIVAVYLWVAAQAATGQRMVWGNPTVDFGTQE